MPARAVTIVSGLPRSGTSMMMRMLAAGGKEVFTDNVRTADADNPKGYFECEKVKNLAREADWLAEAEGKAVKIISHLLPCLPDGLACDIIFMRRAIEEVLASQKKMLERAGETRDDGPEAVMAAKFAMHLRKTERLLAGRPGTRVLMVAYADVLASPLAEARRVADFLGGGLDPLAMSAEVDPALYRNRKEA